MNLIVLFNILVEAGIAYFYLNRVLIRKQRLPVTILSFLAAYVIIALAYEQLHFTLNALCFLLVHLAIIRINYRSSWPIAFLHSLLLTFVMASTDILSICIVTMLGPGFNSYLSDTSVLILVAVLSKVLYFAAAFIMSGYTDMKRFPESSSSIVLVLSILPAFSLVTLTGITYILSAGDLSSGSFSLIAVSLLALLLANYIIFPICRKIQSTESENASLQLSLARDEADAETYRLLRSQYEAQRILIHDTKNHLDVIRTLAEAGEDAKIKEYVSSLEELPELNRNMRLSQDSILNIILLRFSDYCRMNGLSFSSTVLIDQLPFADAKDITALFGNLLSNAVEAAEKTDPKYVDLIVKEDPALHRVRIAVTNSCNQAPVSDGKGHLLSSKADASSHGYGTKSIERVVQKYGGSCTVDYNEAENRFTAVVLLPMLPADL